MLFYKLTAMLQDMDVNSIILYLGLALILFELVKIIPGKNKTVFLPRIVVLSLLLAIHILLLFILPAAHRNPFVLLLLFLLTSMFTLAGIYLKNALNRDLIQNLLKPGSVVLLVYLCNLDYHSKALLTLKSIIPLLLNQEKEAEEMLKQINKNAALKNYLVWNRDVLAVLQFTNRMDLAISFYDSLDINLTEPGVPLAFISIAINILIKKERYDEIFAYFDYMKNYYRDMQHWQLVLYIYLSFYAFTGCMKNFNLLLEKYPAIKNNPLTTYLQVILNLKTGQVEEGLSLLRRFKTSLTGNSRYYLPQVNKILENPDMFSKPPAKGADIALNVLPPEGVYQHVPDLSRKTPKMSGGVIILCGTVFLATLIQFVLSLIGTGFDFISFKNVVPMDYISLGAYSDYYVNQGQWIRLLTAIFLHAGWLHLLLNLYGLYITGRYIEKTYGSFYMVFIFLASGIIGNIASHFISPYPLSLGASGGVFGLFASILIYVVWHRKLINRAVLTNFIINFAIIIGINILFGFQNPQINNIAHFGGFAGGAGISILYLLINKNLKITKLLDFFLKISIILCTCLLLYFWPKFFTYDYINNLDLEKEINISGYSLKGPELWELQAQDNSPDIIIDFLTGSIIRIFNDNVLFAVNDFNALIAEDNYGKDYFPETPVLDFGNGWYYFELKEKVDKPYDLITFYNKSLTHSYCLVECYKKAKYSEDFDELMKRVLPTITDD